MFATSPSWSMSGKCKIANYEGEKTKPAETPSPCRYFPEKVNEMHSPSWKYSLN